MCVCMSVYVGVGVCVCVCGVLVHMCVFVPRSHPSNSLNFQPVHQSKQE